MPHQREAFDKTRAALNAVRPDAAEDLTRAFDKSPALIGEAANGRTAGAIRAMTLEAEIRIDTNARADRFVSDWQDQVRRYHAYRRADQYLDVEHSETRLTAMAKSLERDPQLESVLRNRRIELGLKARASTSLSHDLQEHLGLSRGRGIGR